jgi:hypothetical protein
VKNKPKENKFFKCFELMTEIIGWVEIMISPTLITGIIGVGIYFYFQNFTGKIIGISIASIGVLIGILWATKIFKSKKGTVHFMSRISATPELDNETEEEKKTSHT